MAGARKQAGEVALVAGSPPTGLLPRHPHHPRPGAAPAPFLGVQSSRLSELAWLARLSRLAALTAPRGAPFAALTATQQRLADGWPGGPNRNVPTSVPSSQSTLPSTALLSA